VNAPATLQCFGCGSRLNGLTAGSGKDGERPKPGDFSVCLYCGCLLVFDFTATALRLPWSEERRQFEADPRLTSVRRVVGEVRKRLAARLAKTPWRN